MKTICKQKHRYEKQFTYLAENQGQTGRHKCAGCAYDLGALHARLGIPKANNDGILSSLPESQAGVVRHKDAFEAYNHGYDLVMSMEIKKAA